MRRTFDGRDEAVANTSPRARAATWVLLGVSAVTTAYLTLRSYRTPVALLVEYAISLGALALVTAVPVLRAALTVRVVLLLSAALITVAVVAPPRSDDLWSYTMYGRILVKYHANPYRHTPIDYPGDPFTRRTSIWRGTPAPYGPAFVVSTGAIAWLAGDSALAFRLSFQLIAAIATLVTLLLLARERAPAAALAAIGCNVVVLGAVVNDGHNDALVGLAVLGGALLARRERHVLAALVLTLAAMVKAVSGFGLVAYLVWLAYRHGPRAVVRPVAAAIGLVVVGYAIAGGPVAIGPLVHARDQSNLATIWFALRRGGVRRMLGGIEKPLGGFGLLPTVAIVAALVLAALFTVSRLRDGRPELVIGLAIMAYYLTSLYPSPWYCAWVLPVLALSPGRGRGGSRAFPCMLVLAGIVAIASDYEAVAYSHIMRSGNGLQFTERMSGMLDGIAVVAALVVIVVLVHEALGLLRSGVMRSA